MNRYFPPLLVAMTLVVVSTPSFAEDKADERQPPTAYGWGPGMMHGPGYGYGPGMMHRYGPGYPMGPGMMYGPGYGPGYGHGYGMGPGMMYGPGYGPGYPMGPGMMYGPGSEWKPGSSGEESPKYSCPGMMHDLNCAWRR